jgi:CBS domain-containing protein
MDAVLVVGGVVVAWAGVAWIAYLIGRARAREVIEERKRDRARATRVEALMTRRVVTASPDTTVAQAAELMLTGGFGSVPVVDGSGRLVGMVTESDLTATTRRSLSELRSTGGGFGEDAALERFGERPVSEKMTSRVVTARPGEPVSDVAFRMLDRNIRHVPVVEGGTLIGIITRQDLLSQVAKGGKD